MNSIDNAYNRLKETMKQKGFENKDILSQIQIERTRIESSRKPILDDEAEYHAALVRLDRTLRLAINFDLLMSRGRRR